MTLSISRYDLQKGVYEISDLLDKSRTLYSNNISFT